MDISVAITTFNEGCYLDRLLKDLSVQRCGLSFEIILVEAGNYAFNRARTCLGDLADNLLFIHRPKLSRTESLNLIFEQAKGSLIVRLDARSHIDENYLENIFALAMATDAENVGGVMLPIGLNGKQLLIAEIMKSPFSFGGGKSRKAEYRGYADSVYLGAFRKEKCIFGDEWFDSKHPTISEDSDLNYRIRKNGGRIYIDSSIVVRHYPRETLRKFYRLCFNYGVGRGLFFLKHRTLSAYRQLVLPISLFTGISSLIIGLRYPELMYLPLALCTFYSIAISIVAAAISNSVLQFITALMGFVGCHVCWTAGLLISPVIYRRDLGRNL